MEDNLKLLKATFAACTLSELDALARAAYRAAGAPVDWIDRLCRWEIDRRGNRLASHLDDPTLIAALRTLSLVDDGRAVLDAGAIRPTEIVQKMKATQSTPAVRALLDAIEQLLTGKTEAAAKLGGPAAVAGDPRDEPERLPANLSGKLKFVATIDWQIKSTRGSAEPLDPRLMPLIQAIAETGSLAAAVSRCGISYRAGWGVMRECRAKLGGPLIESRLGQGSALTSLGQRLLHGHKAATEELERFQDEISFDIAGSA